MLTLAAIARELDGKGMNRATVHIAAGLPLTWVATQKEDFQKYLLQNECVDFTFRNKEYHVEFAGADIYPQGFAAAFYRLQDFKGINMLVDIGNGTMNIMYINNSRPHRDLQQPFTAYRILKASTCWWILETEL